jgi:general secretion pathway protein M
MKQLWLEFWQQRNSRERAILSVGAGLLALALLYGLAWLPVSNERKRLAASLPELRVKAQHMREQGLEAAQLKTSIGGDAGATDVRQAIEDSLKAAGLRAKIGAIDRIDNRRIRITLDAVAFDPFAAWVQSLQSEHHIRMESAQIEALPDSGRVKGSATFAGPGGAS